MSSRSLNHPTPFDTIADDYDRLFTESLIGRAQRHAVWSTAKKIFRSGQRLLEINCGTGLDAVHFAKMGVKVLAVDNSARMIAVARRRIEEQRCEGSIRIQRCAIEDLARLESEGPFDGAFSNFGGLNCIADLRQLGHNLGILLKPGSSILLCLLNRYCIWEMGYYLLRLQPEKALRRMSRNGVLAQIGGAEPIVVRYPSISELVSSLAPHFQYRSHEAIGLTVPPSYLEKWVEKHPKFLERAIHLDRTIHDWSICRNMGDHYLVQLETRSC